ncbi:MAG: cbb3-type cytochrome c oxidase subunit 3 [Gemmatimonadota bacterium]
MNPLLKHASESVQMGWLLGAMTVVFLAIFLAWVFYAYRPKHRQLMEELGRMPFTDGGDA